MGLLELNKDQVGQENNDGRENVRIVKGVRRLALGISVVETWTGGGTVVRAILH